MTHRKIAQVWTIVTTLSLGAVISQAQPRNPRTWKDKETGHILRIENGFLIENGTEGPLRSVPLQDVALVEFRKVTWRPAAKSIVAWTASFANGEVYCDPQACAYLWLTGTVVQAPFLAITKSTYFVHVAWKEPYTVKSTGFALTRRDGRSLLAELRKRTGIQPNDLNKMKEPPVFFSAKELPMPAPDLTGTELPALRHAMRLIEVPGLRVDSAGRNETCLPGQTKCVRPAKSKE